MNVFCRLFDQKIIDGSEFKLFSESIVGQIEAEAQRWTHKI